MKLWYWTPWNDSISMQLKRLRVVCPISYSTMSDKPKVFVTRPMPRAGLDLLESECNVQVWPHDDAIPKQELQRQVAGMDALWCLGWDVIDKELLDSAGPSLKVIATYSVGLEHIDLHECRQRNIQVGHTPDVLTDAVAEMTLTLLLAASRRLKEGIAATTNGSWGRWDSGMFLSGQELTGSSVGIVGLGRIGHAVARRVQAFAVGRIMYSDIVESQRAAEVNAELVSFDILLKESDFVIACCSVTKENGGMFNKDVFGQMKTSAVFVNTARGALVNHDDLYCALTSGQIFAAGLDATSPEPLPLDCPLLKLSNCVISPHIASATTRTRNKMATLTAQNILAGLKKQPLPAPAQ